MRYAVEIGEVLYPLEVVAPGRALWGHAEIAGEENAYSCAVVFDSGGRLEGWGQRLPIAFFWDQLPFEFETRALIFHSARVPVFRGTLCKA